MSCSGELHRALGSDQELYFQFFLERFNLLANSGLSDAKTFRCAGKAQVFSDGREVKKITEFHPESRPLPAPRITRDSRSVIPTGVRSWPMRRFGRIPQSDCAPRPPPLSVCSQGSRFPLVHQTGSPFLPVAVEGSAESRPPKRRAASRYRLLQGFRRTSLVAAGRLRRKPQLAGRPHHGAVMQTEMLSAKDLRSPATVERSAGNQAFPAIEPHGRL
jgi:hypothetical protein